MIDVEIPNRLWTLVDFGLDGIWFDRIHEFAAD